jgi:hypothetical protein
MIEAKSEANALSSGLAGGSRLPELGVLLGARAVGVERTTYRPS